jgi:steroid delta-isomerase-like uncharacterized protein
MSVGQNLATMRKAFRAMNTHDFSVLKEVTTPNVVRHELARAFGERKGQKAVSDFQHSMLDILPDLQSKLEDIFATEDRGVMRYTVSGTHKGEFLGVPPTGNKITFSWIALYRFEKGKIAETWQLLDIAGFLRQIGALNI